MDIELRHLRCFLAIANEQNITRAAAVLHMTQPALSRTLRQLEDDLGIRLVDRSTRHLMLTSEGVAFRTRAELVMSALADALDTAALRTRALRVGHSWSAIGEYTSRILTVWEAEHPNEPLELRRIDERSAGVVRGITDVAVVRGDITEPYLTVEVLYFEPRVAAVHIDNPLADADVLQLSQLTPFSVVNNVVSGTTTAALWNGQPSQPSIIGVSNTDDWLMVISSGRAVGVTPSSTRLTYSHPNVVYIPLADAPPVPVSIAWRTDASHAAIADFVALAKRIVKH